LVFDEDVGQMKGAVRSTKGSSQSHPLSQIKARSNRQAILVFDEKDGPFLPTNIRTICLFQLNSFVLRLCISSTRRFFPESTFNVQHSLCATIERMKTMNITIKVESDLVQDAKVLAAKRGTSLSRLVAEQLRVMVQQDQLYAAAKNNALSHLRRGFDLQWEKPASREALHDRESLR
jgi:hypothetical protein